MALNWESMAGRKRDLWVAEHVMGWRRGQGDVIGLWSRDGKNYVTEYRVPRYSTDAGADYLVLERVRETWGQERRDDFGEYLAGLWYDRPGDEQWKATRYRPGDYAEAAFETLAEDAA